MQVCRPEASNESTAWNVTCLRSVSAKSGTVSEPPPPEPIALPVVRPEACSVSTVWNATYLAGPRNASNMMCVIRSWCAYGYTGAPREGRVVPQWPRAKWLAVSSCP